MLMPLSHGTAHEAVGITPATVEVLAVEYPPLMGSQLEDFGAMFRLMEQYASEHFQVAIEPHFMVPAHAREHIQSGDWCLSTYPPEGAQAEHAAFAPVMDGMINMGLLRRNDPNYVSPFIWENLDDLSGSRIAVLQSHTDSIFHQRLVDAGIETVPVTNVEEGIEFLLDRQVDYALGDNVTYSMLPQYLHEQVEMSKSFLFQSRVGFHYNKSCEDQLFKAGHIPADQDSEAVDLTE
ncbi:hypothetical protein LPB41_29260 [Thalassospira sp. MA62]|nr:hypothetical protein [Thalassospira sp. MA62]